MLKNRSFYYFRHGQTEWNLSGRAQGQQDLELNATGRSQAASAIPKLLRTGITEICVSPLKRALDSQDPNPYGNPLRDLWDASAQAISSKLSAIGSAASAAKDKVVSLAQSAAEATVSAGKKVAAGALVGTEGAVAATAAVTGYAGRPQI